MRSWVVPALLALCVWHAAPGVSAGAAADENAAADARALAAPADAAASVQALSAYLAPQAGSDREKARAIYRWITANVAYDASVLDYGLDPNAVLSSRRAVCLGYATLFKALAEGAGLQAEVVIGNSKEFKPGLKEASDSWDNHAWNAVQIAGEWQLLDCCWGAVRCDERGACSAGMVDHYFLTAPDEFAYDHFPSDPSRQLLAIPISKEEYLARVRVRPAFFDCGLRLISHPAAQIEAGSSVDIVVGAARDTFLTACLYKDGLQLAEHYTFTQRCDEGFAVRAVFASEGDYVVRIFARRGVTADGDYDWALDYAVRAQSAAADAAGFPKTYGSFLSHECRLEGPLSRALPAGRKVGLSITVPEAEDVAVVTGGSWQRLSLQGSVFKGEVPVARGDVVIFARFPGALTYQGLLQYVAE